MAEIDTVKSNYRKIFNETAQEIRKQLEMSASKSELFVHFCDELTKKDKLLLAQVNSDRDEYKCSGCGACCKFAVSEFSPGELKSKAQNGDNFASQFISTFVLYKSIEEARKINSEYVDYLEQNTDGKFYIYHCPKIADDNRCPDYENRPQICRDFPEISNIILPKSCAFIPWMQKFQSALFKLNAEKEIINFYLQ